MTALLSNDTTAIVLTPAIFAALARTNVDPLPYLYACAFVANAASFLLPISNPANLVLFGPAIPALLPWIWVFGLSSVVAIGVTYFSLRFAVWNDIQGPYSAHPGAVVLQRRGIAAAIAVGLGALALVVAAFAGFDLGVTALVSAVFAGCICVCFDRGIVLFIGRHVSWQVVPLVAGLFVVVRALDSANAVDLVRHLLTTASALGPVRGNALTASVFAVADNLFNNLPVALAGGFAIASAHVASGTRAAMVVAVDLGPNLSVTGSLATLLWLIVLRREGIEVTPLQFLRLGAVVTIPALAAAALLVR